ncbi:MAG TPA: hypothetical protein DGT21_17050 [Armatimonadetes bacterium]|jgi:hypothetical protein|nr:hypothetical protein [Armatimonadota bacterium]
MNDGARAVVVLAAAVVMVACMPTLGFLSAEAVILVSVGVALAGVAVFAPDLCGRLLAGEWALRGLAVVGPAGLLVGAYRDALAARPTPWAAYLGLVGFVAVAAGLLRRAGKQTPLGAVLPGVVLWCAGSGLLYTKLMYVESPVGVGVVSVAWMAAVIVATAMCLLPPAWLAGRLRSADGDTVRPAPAAVAAVLTMLVLGGATRAGAIIASPDPVIDVYSVLDQTPRALLRGENPYRYQIVSPYGTERARRFGVSESADPNIEIYPPGIIILATPPAAVGADPRWMLLACWLAIGVLVARHAWSDAALHPHAPALLGALMLLPSGSFTAEQAWIDPAYVAFFVLGMAMTQPVVAGLLFGFGLTVKQTAICVLPAMLAHGWHTRATRVAMALCFSLVVLPFLIWDAGEMLRDVVLGFAQKSVHENALSLPGLVLATTGYSLPSVPLVLIALALGVFATWWSRGSAARLVAAAGFTVCAFSLLSKYAYMNWYEGACVILLVAAAWPGGAGREPTP